MKPFSPNPSAPKRRHVKWKVTVIGFLLIVTAVAAWFATNPQWIKDQIAAWQYDLPAEVTTLASDAGLNNHSVFLLDASRAELSDRSRFNQNCSQKESQSVILGCFVNNQIFIYNVTDSRIDGVRTATLAHEMLHAAYARLSNSERRSVDAMITEQMKTINDPHITEIMNIYHQTEPGQELNELHSILATSVEKLNPDIETYYKKYFSDRSKVFAAFQKYSAVFDELASQQSTLVDSLAAQKTVIDSAISQYEIDAKTLADDIDTFNACANQTGCFSSQAEFDSDRANLVARQNNLQSNLDDINTKISSYNDDVAKLNALGGEAEKLSQSLDSRALPITN
jgi:hypothetical protein